MLAKVLVGVLAAIMVTGAGTGAYYVFHGSCDGGCHGKTDIATTEGGSCCSKGCCAHDDEESTEPKACSADATGAFAGGAALTAKTSCKKACCDEE